MNLCELASETSLTQPSLADTLSFLGKPLDLLLLLGLYFCLPVHKHWCIYCKSMDFLCWSKHITWCCTHCVSRTNTEKLQNIRSEVSNWILHSCRRSGPRGAGSGTGCILVMMPSVWVWERVETFHSSSHLNHWVLDYRSLLLQGKYR